MTISKPKFATILISLTCVVIALILAYIQYSKTPIFTDNQIEIWSNVPENVLKIDKKFMTKKELMQKYYLYLDGQRTPYDLKENMPNKALGFAHQYIEELLAYDISRNEGISLSHEQILAQIKYQLSHISNHEAEKINEAMRLLNMNIDQYIEHIAVQERTIKGIYIEAYLYKIGHELKIEKAEIKELFEKNKDKIAESKKNEEITFEKYGIQIEIALRKMRAKEILIKEIKDSAAKREVQFLITPSAQQCPQHSNECGCSSHNH